MPVCLGWNVFGLSPAMKTFPVCLGWNVCLAFAQQWRHSLFVWGEKCALLSPSKEDIPCGLSAVKRVLNCYSPARIEEDTSLFVWGETCAWPFPSQLVGLLICNAICLLPGASATSDDMIRLRRDILSNYSRGIVPKHNQSQALHVNMSFFLIMIHNLVSSFLTRLSCSS